jgi:hypothetical protein
MQLGGPGAQSYLANHVQVRNGDFDNVLDQWTYGAWNWSNGVALASRSTSTMDSLQQSVRHILNV